MPDIFGRSEEHYTWHQELRAAGRYDAYIASRAAMAPFAVPRHDFDALGSGPPLQYRQAGEDAAAFGFLTNNLVQIMSYVDEIMYTAYRLPRFIYINTAIAEGNPSYGYRTMRRVGMAEPIVADGSDAPTAAVAMGFVNNPLTLYGLNAVWTRDEARAAMAGNFPLPMDTINAAIMGTLERLERQTLIGETAAAVRGLFTQLVQTGPSDEKVTHTRLAANMDFASLTATQIRNMISSEISAIITETNEVFGSGIVTGVIVMLPSEQFDLLTTRFIGDNAERTLLKAMLEDNPWTNETGNPIMIVRALELDELGQTAAGVADQSDRMIVTVKTMEVAEVGVSIEPRVIRVFEKEHSFCAPVEAKFSNCWVKRPNIIRYTDGI